MKSAEQCSHKSGFTLVELSVVMIIIGLLIGGVLKGQELIENARITKLISQVKATQTAMLIFRDSYGFEAGDIPRNFGPECNAGNFCILGNGDTWVGTPYTGNVSLGEKFYTDSETTQFWKHLSLADLLSDLNGHADPSTPEWGKTHPEVDMGGGLEIYYERNAIPGSVGPAQFLRYTAQGLNPSEVDTFGKSAATPFTASKIDQKMDDGYPLSGSVTVWDFGDYGCDNRSDGSPGFDSSINVRSCVMFFKIPRS